VLFPVLKKELHINILPEQYIAYIKHNLLSMFHVMCVLL
jgi:hypothetical protein